MSAIIIHIADTFWSGYYPFIDYSTGGSIDGMIQATEGQDRERHNCHLRARLNREHFYRDLLVTTRDKVATLKKQGRSLNEIVAAKPTAAWDDKWGGGFMSPRMFTGLVFEGV